MVTVQPPSSVEAGGPFGLVVTGEDGLGTVDPSFNGSVTLSLTDSFGFAETLGGMATITAGNGAASFANLTVQPADTYILTATAPGLAGTTSDPFAATPGLATQLVAFTQPLTLTVGQPSAIITFQLENAYGSPVSAVSGGVVVNLSATSSGGTFLDANGNPLASPTLTIPQGTATASFEYEDTQTGSPTLVVAAMGLPAAVQQETVDPPNLSFLVNVPNLTATVGTAFNGTVGTFTITDTTVPAASFSATIAWGDGQASIVTPGGGSGSFTVSGSHFTPRRGDTSSG